MIFYAYDPTCGWIKISESEFLRHHWFAMQEPLRYEGWKLAAIQKTEA
jgi:hypothetical protein